MTSGEDCSVFTAMTLVRTDVANVAVAMIDVEPMYEAGCPSAGSVEVLEAARVGKAGRVAPPAAA